MFDLLIRNGTIFDGSRSKAYISDIGIVNDRITEIGNLKVSESRDEIDATGLYVMPGFIDTHVHSDMALLHDRQHANGLCQGITTELLGQDGLSYAPLSSENLEMYAKYLSGLNGWFDGVRLDFKDVDDYLNKFHNTVSINVAYQIAHGAIRLEALGFNDTPLKGYALEKAKNLMRVGFEQGAVAFSTGLSYFPCAYSDTDELVELCKVCVEYDAPFVIHLRSVFKGKPFDPVDEAIEIARRSGVRLHFSHFRTHENNYGKPDELMEPLERAMGEGIEISLDLYPYSMGSGYILALLPPWAVEGGYEATLERLEDPLLRTKITDEVRANMGTVGRTFTHLKKNKQYIGMDFEAVAKMRNQPVEDMICDLLLEEGLEVGHRGNPTRNKKIKEQMEKDFVWLLSRPYYVIGSDGIPVGEKPHPRAFGTFPKFLKLAKRHRMPYEEFANRAACLPAEVFGLKHRGKIEKGYFADIVIFDPENTKDNATYENPRRLPDGIEFVIVNGKIAVYKEKVTGMFSGHAIRKAD